MPVLNRRYDRGHGHLRGHGRGSRRGNATFWELDGGVAG